MFTIKRLIYACVLIIGLLFGFVTLILPGIVVDQAKSLVAGETGRSLSIGLIVGLAVSGKKRRHMTSDRRVALERQARVVRRRAAGAVDP